MDGSGACVDRGAEVEGQSQGGSRNTGGKTIVIMGWGSGFDPVGSGGSG